MENESTKNILNEQAPVYGFVHKHRPKDQIDVLELEKIKSMKKEK